MIVVDTEPHPAIPDMWRWVLLDRATRQRVLTGTEAFWTRYVAKRLGERQLQAMNHTPVIDTTEENPFT